VPTALVWTKRRRAAGLLIAATMIGASLATVSAAGAASADTGVATSVFTSNVTSGYEDAFVNLINALRTSRGLRPLTVNQNMTSLARQHTVAMAAEQHLAHTADLTAGVTVAWERMGENVGFGSNLGLVWNAFLNSPPHLANVTDPVYDSIGVAVEIDGNGILWTTHRFLQVAEPTPPPIMIPPPPPPTVPKPSPAPTPPAPPVVKAPVRAQVQPPTSVTAPLPPAAVEPPLAPGPMPSPADPRSVASLLDAMQLAG